MPPLSVFRLHAPEDSPILNGTNTSRSAFDAIGVRWSRGNSRSCGRLSPYRTLDLGDFAAFRASKKRLFSGPCRHRWNRTLHMVGEFWLLAGRFDARQRRANQWDAHDGWYIIVYGGCERFEFSGKKRFCEFGDYDCCRSGLAANHYFFAGGRSNRHCLLGHPGCNRRNRSIHLVGELGIAARRFDTEQRGSNQWNASQRRYLLVHSGRE